MRPATTTHKEYAVLHAFWEHSSPQAQKLPTLTDICASAQTSRNTVNSLIDRLIGKGLLRRNAPGSYSCTDAGVLEVRSRFA